MSLLNLIKAGYLFEQLEDEQRKLALKMHFQAISLGESREQRLYLQQYLRSNPELIQKYIDDWNKLVKPSKGAVLKSKLKATDNDGLEAGNAVDDQKETLPNPIEKIADDLIKFIGFYLGASDLCTSYILSRICYLKFKGYAVPLPLNAEAIAKSLLSKEITRWPLSSFESMNATEVILGPAFFKSLSKFEHGFGGTYCFPNVEKLILQKHNNLSDIAKNGIVPIQSVSTLALYELPEQEASNNEQKDTFDDKNQHGVGELVIYESRIIGNNWISTHSVKRFSYTFSSETTKLYAGSVVSLLKNLEELTLINVDRNYQPEVISLEGKQLTLKKLSLFDLYGEDVTAIISATKTCEELQVFSTYKEFFESTHHQSIAKKIYDSSFKLKALAIKGAANFLGDWFSSAIQSKNVNANTFRQIYIRLESIDMVFMNCLNKFLQLEHWGGSGTPWVVSIQLMNEASENPSRRVEFSQCLADILKHRTSRKLLIERNSGVYVCYNVVKYLQWAVNVVNKSSWNNDFDNNILEPQERILLWDRLKGPMFATVAVKNCVSLKEYGMYALRTYYKEGGEFLTYEKMVDLLIINKGDECFLCKNAMNYKWKAHWPSHT